QERPSMHRALKLGAVLCGVLWAGPLQGQSRDAPPGSAPDTSTTVLTLDEARRLALVQNPSYLAVSRRVEAARGDVRTARTYQFNPELEIEGPGSLSSGSVAPYEARLAQEIEWAGQWGLR